MIAAPGSPPRISASSTRTPAGRSRADAYSAGAWDSGISWASGEPAAGSRPGFCQRGHHLPELMSIELCKAVRRRASPTNARAYAGRMTGAIHAAKRAQLANR